MCTFTLLIAANISARGLDAGRSSWLLQKGARVEDWLMKIEGRPLFYVSFFSIFAIPQKLDERPPFPAQWSTFRKPFLKREAAGPLL